jgi:hypothetical protein
MSVFKGFYPKVVNKRIRVLIRSLSICMFSIVYLNLSLFPVMASSEQRNIIFIDSNVQNAQILENAVLPGTEVIKLKGDQDGIAQIVDAVAGERGIDSIRIISHGAPGKIFLASGILSEDNLDQYESDLKTIGGLIRKGGSIQIYSCDVAQGIAGRSFIKHLGEMTGVQVAASIDATGPASLGGNWELEYSTADAALNSCFDQVLLQKYEHLLDVTYNSTSFAAITTSGPFITDGNFNFTGESYVGDADNESHNVGVDQYGIYVMDKNCSSASTATSGAIHIASAVTGNVFTIKSLTVNVQTGSSITFDVSFDDSVTTVASVTVNKDNGDPRDTGGGNYWIFETITFVPSVTVSKVNINLSGSPVGQTSSVVEFTVAALPGVPTVTGINPNSGPAAGGTGITITGTNFTGTTAVKIDGVNVTTFTAISATTISAITPAGTAGAKDVVVTGPGGSGTGSGLFTYIANTAPIASNVQIAGVAQVGETLTGSFSITDAEGDTTSSAIRWYRADNAAGTTGRVEVGMAVTYTVVAGDVGKYIVFEVTPTASAGTSPGTAVTAVSGLVTKKAQVSVTYSNVTKIYGDGAFTHTATGGSIGVFGYTSSDTSVATIDSVSGSVTIKKAGTTTLTAIKAGDAYYEDASKTCTLVVNKAHLTATVGDYSKTYGDANPAFAVTVTGFENSETAATAAGYTAPAAACAATTTTGVGTYSIIISGGAATNYTFSTTDVGILAIAPKTIAATAAAIGKVYNGNTTGTGTIGLTGLVNADSVTSSGIFAFTNTDAGTNKTVNVTGITLGEAKAGNYSLNNTTASAIADITPKTLGVTVTADSKAYDSTTTATGTVTLSGIIVPDAVTASGTFAFTNASVGTGKTVNVTGITLGGADAGNYAISSTTASAIANITKIAQAAVTYNNVTKAYGDAAFTHTATGGSIGVFSYTSSDPAVATIDSASGSVTLLKAGTTTLTAIKAGDTNYDAVSITCTLTVNKAPLTTTVGNYSKAYGDANPTFTVAVTGFVNGETTSSAIGYTAPTAACTATAITVVGNYNITISGGSATNYTVNSTATGILTVNRKTVTSTAAAISKTYNGNTAGTGTIGLTGILNADTVTAGAIFTFTDADIGMNKAVYVTGITLGGAKEGNYSLTNTTASAIADISPKTLAVTVTANNKVYDGNTSATGTVTLSGIVAPDTVTASAIFTFANAAVGTGKTVNVTNIALGGAKAGNYVISSTTASAIANITEQVQNNTGTTNGGNTTITAPTVAPVIVIINGRAEDAGTATTEKEGDKTVTTITVDEKKLEQRLVAEGNNAVITIPVNTASDIKVGELNGQMVKNMESKEAIVEVKTPTATYTLPAQQINIAAISKEIGQNVELKDIKVRIEISQSAANTVKVVENSARKGEFTIVAPPVDFTVRCTSENKTVEVKTFSAYVERTIAIPAGVDPSKITTGIVIEPDGTTRHVPTKIIVIDGKYYARINSLANSTYSVVWHPLEFKDTANHWAKEAIDDMGSRMVINGTGNDIFEPGRDITRAEFAAVVVRGLGLKPGAGKQAFKDVKSTEWYCDYIKTAVEYKIISGYGNGKFGPMDKITREQAMTMIARAMSITRLKADLKSGEAEKLLAASSETAGVAKWAIDSVATCIKAKIIPSRDGNPVALKENITRAEVALIVRQLLQKSGLI